MIFEVITKVVDHKILYKFGCIQFFIQSTIVEIEREEWEAVSHMYSNVKV